MFGRQNSTFCTFDFMVLISSVPNSLLFYDVVEKVTSNID